VTRYVHITDLAIDNAAIAPVARGSMPMQLEIVSQENVDELAELQAAHGTV